MTDKETILWSLAVTIGLISFVRLLHPATVSFGTYFLALGVFGVFIALIVIRYER